MKPATALVSVTAFNVMAHIRNRKWVSWVAVIVTVTTANVVNDIRKPITVHMINRIPQSMTESHPRARQIVRESTVTCQIVRSLRTGFIAATAVAIA